MKRAISVLLLWDFFTHVSGFERKRHVVLTEFIQLLKMEAVATNSELPKCSFINNDVGTYLYRSSATLCALETKTIELHLSVFLQMPCIILILTSLNCVLN